MRTNALITMTLFVVVAGLLGAGCKKKDPGADISYHHSAEGTHEKMQEMKKKLTDALGEKNLEAIHDQMYYLQGLAKALSSKLEGEKKQRVDAVLKELAKIADEIDNSAGRGNLAATEANLQKLLAEMEGLAAQFNDGQKK